MPERTLGHIWSTAPAAGPVILTAMECVHKHAQPIEKCHANQSYWVLDYEFASYGAYCTRSRRGPWRPRLPHTAHLYPPRVVYWEDTRRERGNRHSAWVCFHGGEALGLGQLVHEKLGYARFLDPAGELGALLSQTAHVAQESGEAGFLRAQSLLYASLDLLVRSTHLSQETYSIAAERPPSESVEFAHAVERYLKDRLGQKVTLAALARHLHVSVSSLSHRYKDATNETPLETFARLRTNHAKALLLKGLSLKVVAERLGFSDPFHLSRTFKRVESLSPRDYLRAMSAR